MLCILANNSQIKSSNLMHRHLQDNILKIDYDDDSAADEDEVRI